MINQPNNWFVEGPDLNLLPAPADRSTIRRHNFRLPTRLVIDRAVLYSLARPFTHTDIMAFLIDYPITLCDLSNTCKIEVWYEPKDVAWFVRYSVID